MVIEMGDVGAWPEGVLSVVDEWIRASGKEDRAVEQEIRAMFSGAVVRAYHCARYLDHEVASIRSDGLRVATRALFDERIKRAAEVGAITTTFRDELLSRHALSQGDDSQGASGRARVTCFAVPRSYLNSQLGASEMAMGGFLTWWGGEALFTACDESEKEVLSKVGRPGIVVATFDVASWLGLQSCISLLRLCVDVRCGKPDAASEIQWRETIGPPNIEAIWQPGDPDYDALDRLPRR